MRNLRASQSKDRLDHLFSQVNEISDLRLQAHWARYLCILVSGFIETSTRSILVEYTRIHSSPNVTSYIEKQLEYRTNLNMQRLLELLGAFNSEWRTKLDSSVTEEMKATIDGIVANRNLIAHGENVGISFVRIRDCYQNAIAVIELIEEQCNP